VTTNVALAPGLYYEALRPPADPQPLRSDIAAFVGRTRRGPIGVAIRVEGWREYIQVFGDLVASADTPYAIRGYFENGGELAWIVRLPDPELVTGVATWSAVLDSTWGTPLDRYDVIAATPGTWSTGAQIELVWHHDAMRAAPVFDITVHTADDGIERLDGVPADQLATEVARRSNLIRFVPGAALGNPPAAPNQRVRRVVLAMAPLGVDQWPAWLRAQLLPSPDAALDPHSRYLAAVDALIDQPEVALLAFPDLFNDFSPDEWAGSGDAADVLRTAIAAADELRDRLVLVDLPPHDALPPVAALLQWLDVLGRIDGTHIWRAAAAYHPPIWVQDPLGGVTHPLRRIAPSGHVAGSISQTDRERGAHQTPANVPLLDVVDLTEERTPAEHGLLNDAGLNLIRCVSRRGFAVMGGRTLDRVEGYRFVAHRRLLHRLVRAIQSAAEPLVFETNGPDLWVAFVRAATQVLLAAWRVGALKGERPEQAFRVQCDADTNPPAEIDSGRCVCLIAFAPAVPMEFILLRVAVSRDGSLEVLT